MELNDLLIKQDLDPRDVLVFRHRPYELQFRKVLPWLAAERPDWYNAYQQTQGPRVERTMNSMVGSGLVASFIGHEPGKAMFVGVYRIAGARPLSYKEYWSVPAYVGMKQLGMAGWSRQRNPASSVLWFDLQLTEIYEEWKGRLVVQWPPPERSWWRRAHKNDMPVLSISEDNSLATAMPEWDELDLSWAELSTLPSHWRAALSQWRGVYYIFDEHARKGYVGSAYGRENILGRWRDYAARGHGGNKLLRKRDPSAFRFSILQRVSPDMDPSDVINLESSWKRRLHSRQPNGLNEN